MINCYTRNIKHILYIKSLINNLVKGFFVPVNPKVSTKNFVAITFIIVLSIFPVQGYAQTYTFSSTNPAIIGSTINQGSSNQPIYAAVVQVTGSGWGGNFTNLTFTATGTFVATDINYASGVSGYKVWASKTNNLSTASQISNPYQATNSGTQVSIIVNRPWFNIGETWYIWITADISSTAVGGHTLTVGALTPNNLTFNRATAKSGTMYAAGTQVIGSQALYNSNGTYTFTVPAGVYSLKVEAWGSGAGGNNNAGKNYGGGGGAYSGNYAISVNPGDSYTVTVGKGGAAGVDGQSSSFGSLVIAAGAKGQNGGTVTNSTGAILYGGGNGGSSTADGGAGGGGSGGSGGSGGTGSNSNSDTGGSGGAAGIAATGSAGATGGAGGSSVSYWPYWYPGNNGNSPGGGGGETSTYGSGSGTGGDGQVLISWATPATIWLKADAGTSTTTDGVGVNTWNDQSGSSNTANSKNTAPTYQSLGWNFNPNINFSTGSFVSTANNIFNDMTYFAVFNSTQNTSNGNFWLNPAIVSCEKSGTQADYFIGTKNGTLFFKGTQGDVITTQTGATYIDGLPKIVAVTRKQATGATNYIYVNGSQAASGTSDNNDLTDQQQIGIGDNPENFSLAQFQGGICEVFGQRNLYSTKKRQSFESYLAIKYGVTLTHDYTSSDSTSVAVYSISGYNYDIAGLGRDVVYGLNQKISSSSNFAAGSSRIVMATTLDFTSSNLNGARTALTNGQYLIWGHNNLATNKWVAVGNGSSDSTVNRVWKVQNTGYVAAVNFQIDLTGYPFPFSGAYALLVDNNTDFSTGATAYTLTNTTGNLYTVSVTFPLGTSYFTICARKNYWKGSASSTDWGTAINWTAGIIPPAGADVEYANGINYSPSALNDLVLDQTRTIGSLRNSTTRKLTIPVGLGLTVNNTITTDGNPGRIYIQSSQSAPTLPSGSLIFHNTSIQPVNATVEMYTQAQRYNTPFVDNNTLIKYYYTWQYFGIPLTTVKADPTFYGSFVRRNDETSTNTSGKWISLGNADDLTPFIGYEITQDAPTTIIFQGTLVNSDKQIDLGYTSSAYDPGQNMLANPYTSAIDINKLTFASSTTVENTVYLYNTGSYAQWANNNGEGNSNSNSNLALAGQYIAIPKGQAGTGSIPSDIPSMSAFMVKAISGPVPAGITVKYSDVIMPNKNAQRAPQSKTSTDKPYMEITLNGAHLGDRMWLINEPGTSHGFDNGWDGTKVAGSVGTSQLFAMEESGNYQVSTSDDMNNTCLGFQGGIDLEDTLTFKSENLGLKYDGVYLVDLVENRVIDITKSGTQYTFKAESTPAPVKRFKITTEPYVKDAQDLTTQIKVFNDNDAVFVDNSSNQNGELYFYDLMGRYLKKEVFGPNSISSFPLFSVSGVYIVKAVTTTEKVSKQIIVK